MNKKEILDEVEKYLRNDIGWGENYIIDRKISLEYESIEMYHTCVRDYAFPTPLPKLLIDIPNSSMEVIVLVPNHSFFDHHDSCIFLRALSQIVNVQGQVRERFSKYVNKVK